jgi:uncharacterized protein YggE
MTRWALSISLALLCLTAALPAELSAQTVRDGRIRVLGQSVIESKPDYAIVRVGVSNKAATPTAALDQTSGVARKIIDFSKKFGIEEKDIQTDIVNLMPVTRSVRDPSGNFRQEPDGYSANNTVRVKLSDLSQLGAFMRQVLDQGATNIAGLDFGLSNFEQVAAEARTKAVENAMQQAQGLAQAAKVKLGSIHEIVHAPRDQMPFVGLVGVPDMRRARQEPVPIATGMVRVEAEVEITWTIE